MEHNSVGGRLVALRKHESVNLSARKMAISIGIDPSQYLKIEKDLLNLPYDKAKELHSLYGASPDWVMTGEGEMFTQSISDRVKNSSYVKIDKSLAGDFKKHMMQFKAFLYGKIQNLSYPTPQMRQEIQDLEEELEFMKKLLKEREEQEKYKEE